MKTESARQRVKEDPMAEISDVAKKHFRIGAIDVVFLGIAIYVYADLYPKSIFVLPVMNYFVKIYLFFAIIGFAGGFIVNFFDAYLETQDVRQAFREMYIDFKKSFTFKDFILFGIGFGTLSVVQYALNVTQSVTSLDQFGFYLFAGVVEEYFYRYFITSAIYYATNRLVASAYSGKEPKSFNVWNVVAYLASMTISVAGTSYFFYVSHTVRYTGDINGLIVVFILSVVETIIFIYNKSLLVCILIHLLNNFFAFRSLLVTG